MDVRVVMEWVFILALGAVAIFFAHSSGLYLIASGMAVVVILAIDLLVRDIQRHRRRKK